MFVELVNVRIINKQTINRLKEMHVAFMSFTYERYLLLDWKSSDEMYHSSAAYISVLADWSN